MLGKAVPRKEDERLITGRGLYVEDVQLPGMLYASFVRSPYARAEILRVKKEAALAVPGVVGVYDGSEWPELKARLPELNGSVTLTSPYIDHIKLPDHLLFPKRASYVGEQVAVVLAETPYAAADGAAAVEVEYEPLPAVARWEEAMKPGSPRVHEGFDNVVAHLKHKVGDADAAFAQAEIVLDFRLETQSLKSMAIECRAVAAQFDAATHSLNIWSTGQFPFMMRNTIAGVLGLPNDQVRVIARDVGGGFGLKGVLYAEDVIIPVLAYHLRCPIRWAETRNEHMISANHSGNQAHDVRVAAKRDGTLLGLELKLYKEVGAYDHFDMMLQINTINHLTTHYKVPALRIEGWAISTNTPPGSPYRGAGRVEAVFTMDRVLDAIARETNLDPLEVRKKNIVTPADMPYRNGQIYRDGVPVEFDGIDFPLLLKKAVERADYDGWRKRQKELRAQGRAIGIGIGSYIEAGGLGPCEGSRVKIDEQGRVSVFVGVNSQGQSHETTLAQVAAHTLGAKFEDVSVFGGDTRLMDFGFGTGASRVAVNAGNAVMKAAGEVRNKVVRYAAQVLNCAENEIVINDSVVSVAGATQNFIKLGDLAARSIRDRRMIELGGPGLHATEFFYPRTVVWGSGVNVAVVEVDRRTGAVEILKYVIVHDCGLPLNPLVVDGQISGGFAQGLGIALGEHAVFDEDGQVLSGSLMDYYVPRIGDVPEIDVEHVVFPTKDNPLGIKSVGESAPNAPGAALSAAIEDALERKIRITRLPVTRSTILSALRAA
ncbi:MAG: xanthine dehydrogenase family protein molybdopterin-binding subunit [Xanthobacteraceae bacterium]|nr:xanthine dehydrogenase family protein molybdopterin-binding subunit [Xanthobacteraceae bacterium]MCW5678843.1 xanthine dehydrogenase family protein molybdopterin-binding subunit [Xanthobacteraceae bacterium]